MANRFQSPVFILGLPRSGTSMVAGSLAGCGAWLGTTVPGTDANPKGFFEHAVIREQILKPMLQEVGCDPLGVRSLPNDQALRRLMDSGLTGRIKKIIQADGYTGSRIWLYKDAKLSLLWPVFANAFPRARWIVVRRARASFIDSCLRTSFMRQHSVDTQFWDKLYEEYTTRLRDLKQKQQKVYVLEAESIASGNFDKLEKLCPLIGLRFNKRKVEEFVSHKLLQQPTHQVPQ